MEILHYSIYVLTILFAHAVQTITGFGSMVLGLPVYTFLFPLKTVIPALVVVNAAQDAYLAISQRRHINRKQAKIMIPLALLGLPIGYSIYSYLPAEGLKIALGVFVIAVATWNLAGVELKQGAPKALYYPLNFFGGITQGALASGGPFLVIYAAKMMKDKSEFRATMCLLWAVLNAVLCCMYTYNHTWQREMLPLIFWTIPPIVVATIAGQYLHSKIPPKPFKKLIFTILLLSGMFLLLPLFKLLV